MSSVRELCRHKNYSTHFETLKATICGVKYILELYSTANSYFGWHRRRGLLLLLHAHDCNGVVIPNQRK